MILLNKKIYNIQKNRLFDKKIIKKKERKSNLFNYFTFDDFYSFERVDFFSFVVNFRC